MNYEKKYKEAQKWIESIYSELSHEHQMEAESFFHELNESKDEKIRKEIIETFKNLGDGKTPVDINYADIFTWLEKQGEQKVSYTTLVETGNGGINALVTKELPTNGCDDEQKPSDKVEPKFHEGEWITNGDYTWKIVEVKPLDYILQSQEGNIVDDTISHVDEQFHSFTIKDAKDGDVLASELCDSIILFRGIKDNNVDFYCDYDFSKIDIPGDRFSINDGQHYGDVEDSKDFHPATKEQRDTLIKAMTDAGWEFDFEKKELKKISQRMVSAEAKEALYDKPAWSEEDEYRINRISDFIWKNRKGDTDEIYQQEQDVNWLKSLKNKVQPQPKHEWSEEDEKNLRRAIRTTKVVYPEAADWLKSIGNRITWKPSKGQLECLGYAIDKAEKDYSPLANNRVYLTLKSLKEQLKKLIE